MEKTMEKQPKYITLILSVTGWETFNTQKTKKQTKQDIFDWVTNPKLNRHLDLEEKVVLENAIDDAIDNYESYPDGFRVFGYTFAVWEEEK